MTDLRHPGDGEARTHAELLLCGAYLTGGLDAAGESAFERHLATCVECMDECDRLAPVAAGFADLPASAVEALLAEPWPPAADALALSIDAAPIAAGRNDAGSNDAAPIDAGRNDAGPNDAAPIDAGRNDAGPKDAAPIATGRNDAGPKDAAAIGAGPTDAGPSAIPAPDAPAGGRAGSPVASRGPAGPTRPPGRSDSGSPGRGRRRWLATGVLAAIVLVGGGVTAAIVAARPSPHPVRVQQVDAVTAEGEGASSRLSVSVTADGDASVARATVSGLGSGTRYRLYAIDTAGASHLVAQWTAGPDPREVTGRVAVPLADLAFFSVTRAADDAAVISARVVHSR